MFCAGGATDYPRSGSNLPVFWNRIQPCAGWFIVRCCAPT